VLLPALLLLVGCGGDGGGKADGQVVEILALDQPANVFQPEDVTVTVGTKVVFRNAGLVDHNVIPENRTAKWRIDVPDFHPGDSDSSIFTEPGVYRYYCSLHGTLTAGMKGSITVVEAPAPSTT
jgi:plastocyanin